MEIFTESCYKLEALCCGKHIIDNNWNLTCSDNHKPALLRTRYDKKQIVIKDLPGLYKFSDWLPINRILSGSAAPVTYKSIEFSKEIGLNNLFITFNGYWTEKGAFMQTGTFKECEAFSVCARKNPFKDKIMVVASAGNTARAFARVCSENNIPLLITIPADNINALWFNKPLNPCVRIIAVESGADYTDAINLSDIATRMDQFYPEGGARNIARRDGMASTVVSAVTTIGRIPDYYFQAIGSGTGAIAAWEANLRFIEDGRFGKNKMKLIVSQNIPFTPVKEAWDAGSDQILPMNDNDARKNVEEILAKVLSNRRPPYSITGGLYDALKDTNGEVLSVTNEQLTEAGNIFKKLEGIDIDPAASVAVASLIESVKAGTINKDSVIMLNITGGGINRFKQEHQIFFAEPDIIFPINPDPEDVNYKLSRLF